MGLDMYLERMPRHRDATANDVRNVENYLDWIKAKADGSEHAQCSFEKWCGAKKTPPKEYLEFYADHYKARYSGWDVEHKYPITTIMEQAGYWRKANQIHNWFVENIQGGIDDCNYHREVKEEDLLELLDICQRVVNSCKLVDGKINNGYKFENGKMEPVVQDGKYIEDASVAEELLPSTSGFFFGGTDYDEYYLQDIKDTIDIINKVLETTDFDTQMLYYVSSW